MFKRQVIASALALALVGGALSIKLLHIEKQDYIAYKELLESSNPSKENHLTSISQQSRQGVCKQLWFNNKDPIFCQIKSADSELSFYFEDNQIKVVEKMGVVHCIVQEERFYLLPDGREAIQQEDGRLLLRHASPDDPASWVDPSIPGLTPMQLIRYMQADKATYDYASQLFVAEDVKLWKYKLEGHEPPSALEQTDFLMSGTARSVEFAFKGEKFDLQAHSLKATFDPEREML